MSDLKKVNLSTTVVQSDNLLKTELDDETVMMSLERAAYYGLDSTARKIWNLINEPRLVDELCEILIDTYTVDRQTCQHQVCVFLEDLHREGLIQIVDPSRRTRPAA